MGSGFVLVMIVIGIAFWFLAIQPQRRRQQAHLAMQDAVEVGAEVITAGGMHGRVLELDDSIVRLEIAPGTAVRVDRRAIAAVAAHDDRPGEEELEPDEESPEPGSEAG